MGFANLIIELDVIVVISFITMVFNAHPSLSLLVDDCRWLLKRISYTKVKHVFKKANSCVDALAELGSTQAKDFILFPSPSSSFKNVIDFDNYTNV
jgi:hypothetical protein